MTTGTPNPGSLLAGEADHARLSAAESLIVLIGGYDGTRNFGDVLQTLAALERVRGAGPEALIAVIGDGHYSVEHIRAIGLGDAAVLRFHTAEEGSPVLADGEQAIEALRGITMVYLTGGGYLNGHWGNRKLAQMETVNALVAAGGSPGVRHVVTTGVQVTDYPDLWRWAGWLTTSDPLLVRDDGSLGVLRAAGVSRAANFGDDAYAPLIAREVADAGPACLNVHLNVEPYSSPSPESRGGWLVDALATAAQTVSGLECKILIAYDDERVGELASAGWLTEAYRGRASEQGLPEIGFETVILPRLATDVPIPLGRLGTISSSYHVGLLSLLHGVPTLLFAENKYYEQKMTGLASSFGLGPEAIVTSRSEPDLMASLARVAPLLAAAAPWSRQLLAAQIEGARFAVTSAIRAFERDTRWAQVESFMPAYREAVEESFAMHRRVDLASEVLLDSRHVRDRELESLNAELAVLRDRVHDPGD